MNNDTTYKPEKELDYKPATKYKEESEDQGTSTTPSDDRVAVTREKEGSVELLVIPRKGKLPKSTE